MRVRSGRKIWLVALMVFVAVFLFTFLTAKFKDNIDVEAANLANFDPGYIISDYQMGNYNSMSEAEIWNFLKQKGNCNDTRIWQTGNNLGYLSESAPYSWHVSDGHYVCLADENFSGESAAHIIWQAAQDYRINPQVLIVLLQKEQGLITDSFPNSVQYRSATGYGCPDTAACSSRYYGFKNQVRNAAALFRTVLDGGWTNYPLGNNYIQYNPNSGCGGSWVNIRSLATSALYRYTPYQPNASALAAGYGAGDSCGAYGNRNFYSYFEDWFGGVTSDYSMKFGRTIPDGTYQIIPMLHKDKAVDIYGGIRSEMTSERIILYERKKIDSDRLNQTFEIEFDAASGYYFIYNKESLLYMGVDGNSLSVGKKNTTCNQWWNIKRKDIYYELISACDGRSVVASSDGGVLVTNVKAGNDAAIWKMSEISGKTHVLEDGEYQISSVISDKYALDIKGGVKSGMSSGEVILWTKRARGESKDNQVFNIKYDEEGGYYTIINPTSQLSLDVYNSDVLDGTRIIAWRQNDGCNQRWMIKEGIDGYEIISMCAGKALDVPRGDAGLGREIILYTRQNSKNQKWNFEKVMDEFDEEVRFDENSDYIIATSIDSGVVLDISGGVSRDSKSGEAIVYGRKTWGNNNQIFRFRKDKSSESYYIYNPLSGLYLDVYNGNSTDGTRVILWPYNGGCNQRWIINKTDDGFYVFMSACTKKVMDLSGGNVRSLTPIIIYSEHGGRNQKWAILKNK